MTESKLYRLIVAPQYRIWRHALFILTLGIITFNQVFIAYQDCTSLLGYQIYFICLASLATYIVAIYINYFLLIPKLLLKERYIRYVVFLLILVFLLLIVNILMEYEIRTFLELPHRIKSYTNPLILIDSLSSSMITIICFGSMSAITLLRKRNDKSKHINELEYNFLQSEINKLKGQISPSFLSVALLKSANLTKSDPQRASDILMQVGQLLRYQLYDCEREKVLLSSEINFISNFLRTRKLVTENHCDYAIEKEGNTNNILITPLLLIFLVQYISMNNKVFSFKLNIKVLTESVFFEYLFNEDCIIADKTICEMKHKLELLYPDLYMLNNERGKIQLQLNIS